MLRDRRSRHLKLRTSWMVVLGIGSIPAQGAAIICRASSSGHVKPLFLGVSLCGFRFLEIVLGLDHSCAPQYRQDLQSPEQTLFRSRLFTPHRFKVHPRQASLDGDRYCALPSRLKSENFLLEYLSGLLSVRMVAYIGALSGTYARRQQNGRKFSNCDPRRQYVNPLVVWRLAI